MAVKKAMFKIGAFFKGFLIPLAENATTREAIIIGSILQKMSINALDVAAALVKMTSWEYKLGNGYFIKVLVSKRYTLPTMVLDELVNFFCKTGMSEKQMAQDNEYDEEQEDDEEIVKEMPVMWHQTVLALVQCYKMYFSAQQKKKI
jgi:essential nuclear protein 1